jgi:hypothetical protein
MHWQQFSMRQKGNKFFKQPTKRASGGWLAGGAKKNKKKLKSKWGKKNKCPAGEDSPGVS